MTTHNTLSSAATHVIAQYNDAGKTLVSAYRSGAQRLLGRAGARYGAAIGRHPVPLVGENIQAGLLGTHEKVAALLARRLDTDSSRLVALMDRIAERATGGIESVAKRAARVEAPLATSILDTVARLQQPVADLSVKIADKVAAGARKIEHRAAGASQASPEEVQSQAPRRASRAGRA